MRIAATLVPALHALRVHRLRTGLALMGISFGVAAVVLIVSWGAMWQMLLDDQIRELGSDVLILMPGEAKDHGASRGTGTLPTITEADAEAIGRDVPGIAAAAPLMRGVVQVIYGNRNQSITLRGVTPAWFDARPWPVIRGRPLTDEDVRRSAKVVLLGYRVSRNLFEDHDPIDQIIRIKQVPFTVIGVLEEKGHSLGGDDFDDQVAIPLTTARKRILGFFAGQPTAVGGVTLRVASGIDMAEASNRTRNLLRERHHLKNGDSDDFILRDAAAVQRAQAHSAWIVALMLVAAAAVALVVAGVGIMNLMLVSVRERRQEIGLRMAVGARRRDIALQFLIEAALLALFGSAVGVVLGLVGGAAIGTAAALWNSQTLVAILAAVSSATAITLVSALYPSLQASHLDPAEALADA